jgi:2-hydroxy-3-keto-5-methylthiopentenyl-1-phosphate phosphatase
MYKYLLCLDKQYNVNLGEDYSEILNNYATMIDNLVYMLQSYGVEEDEILEGIKDDTTIEIEEVDE